MLPPVAALLRRSRRVLLSLAVFGLLLLGLEAGLRAAGFASGPALYFDPQIGYRFYPGKVREMQAEKTGVAAIPVRINDFGYRGRAPSSTAPFEGTRIVCLGDSFTFGWGVRDGEEYPAVLGRGLEEDPASGPVEVLNLGVGGYNVWNSLQTYRHVARPLAPDIVIFGFFINDLEPAVPGLPYSRKALIRSVGHTAIFEALHRYVLASDLGTQEERDLRRDYFAHRGRIQNNPQSRRGRIFWDPMLADLEALAQEVHADGAELLVLIFPQSSQVLRVREVLIAARSTPFSEATQGLTIHQDHLTGCLGERGIAHLDLLETIVRAPEPLFSQLSAGHPGAGAFEATAQRVQQELFERGWLPAQASRGRPSERALGE